MALTILEQLSIIKGITAPSAATLKELVEQITFNASVDYFEVIKDTSGDQSASNFVNKKIAFFNTFQDNTSFYIDRLVKILIAIYSDTGDFATVEAASDDQWITFLENNIVEAIEVLSLITPTERNAYNAISVTTTTTTTV